MAFALATEPIAAIPLMLADNQVIYIGGTRIPLDTVVEAFMDGATPEEISYQYPSLPLADIYAVVGYYLSNRGEVETYLEQRRYEAARVRRRNEQAFPPEGVRARLLARRQL
jgi:uncharacterized protein (DUF433 family)